jgi:hypothetical protein
MSSILLLFDASVHRVGGPQKGARRTRKNVHPATMRLFTFYKLDFIIINVG